MEFKKIDLEHWERKPYYEHYLHSVCCTYSITVNLDITLLQSLLKQQNLKLYPAIIYLLSVVANNHVEFRMDFNENGELGFWNKVIPNYCVFHTDNESFSNIWTEFDPDFAEFYSHYTEDIAAYGDIKAFNAKADTPPNTFSVSCIPWTSFAGFNLNIYGSENYLPPIFTLGKYFLQTGKILLPLAVQCHHCVCDGFHVSRFINELQKLASSPNKWMYG